MANINYNRVRVANQMRNSADINDMRYFGSTSRSPRPANYRSSTPAERAVVIARRVKERHAKALRSLQRSKQA